MNLIPLLPLLGVGWMVAAAVSAQTPPVAAVSPSAVQAQYAAIRSRVLGDLDRPHDSVMPFACQQVAIGNKVAKRHFIRGCNLLGVYDPHDNMTSTGLSKREMQVGLDRAMTEFRLALQASRDLAVARRQLEY